MRETDLVAHFRPELKHQHVVMGQKHSCYAVVVLNDLHILSLQLYNLAYASKRSYFETIYWNLAIVRLSKSLVLQ